MPPHVPQPLRPQRHRPSATGHRIGMRGMIGLEAAGIATAIATAIVMCAEMRRATHNGIRAAMGVRAATTEATIAAMSACAATAGKRSAIQARSAGIRHCGRIKRRGRT